MLRIAALDIGDIWTGIAVSDPLKITSRPFDTVETKLLTSILPPFIQQERVEAIVVGLPITLKATHSEQTQKVLILLEQLKKAIPSVTWHTHDERLSSARAARKVDRKKPDQRKKSHAIAAADFLQTFLNRHYSYRQ